MNHQKLFLVTGAIAGLLGVALGAFGAHGLEKLLSPAALKTYHTAVEYQLWHAIVLLLVGVLAGKLPGRMAAISGYCLIAGIALFSGSLYLYLATGIKALVMITPVGGSLLMAGWAFLAIAAWQIKSP